MDYLDKWGDRFYEDVEYRIKEVVHRFENEVRNGVEAKVGGSISIPTGVVTPSISAGRDSASVEREAEVVEIRQEVVERAKSVVNDIQVQQLGGILDLLEEMLSDSQKPCYITIDQLDEPWADDDIRLRLLKGLLDTVREFRKVHNAKVIICLRVDLLEQLFRLTRSEAGFQEEKYRSLYLPLRWTSSQLVELLDKRVAKLVRDAYTKYEPTLLDIVPESIQFGRKRRFKTLVLNQATFSR